MFFLSEHTNYKRHEEGVYALNLHNQIVPSCQPEEDIFGIYASSTAEVFIKNLDVQKSSSTMAGSSAEVKKDSSHS